MDLAKLVTGLRSDQGLADVLALVSTTAGTVSEARISESDWAG